MKFDDNEAKVMLFFSKEKEKMGLEQNVKGVDLARTKRIAQERGYYLGQSNLRQMAQYEAQVRQRSGTTVGGFQYDWDPCGVFLVGKEQRYN